ncbi:hypothetical protein LTR08_001125 [Meristemomyces frigidus]|nr:hypothetical protein LTR08_001125 [Meristemomyces frigidus]
MAKNNRAIFDDEDSDTSVATNSTAESEATGTYNVEKILAESINHKGDGKTYYLLKWERYPIYEATWEPPEHIDSQSLIDQWGKEKQLVREGKLEPFDLTEYGHAIAKSMKEEAERKKRRKEKRRKRGISVSPEAEADEVYEESDVEETPNRRHLRRKDRLDSGDEDVAEATKSTHAKRKWSPVPRKGIAQKVNLYPRTVESEEGEINSGDDGRDESEPNSLLDASSQHIYPEATPRVATTRTGKVWPSLRSSVSLMRPSTKAEVGRTLSNRDLPVPARLKPAAAVMTAKKTLKTPNIFANWTGPTSKTCPFAHYPIDPLQPHHQAPLPPPPPPRAPPTGFTGVKKQTTCFYWQKGHCKFTEALCEFAHSDTGAYTRMAHQRDPLDMQICKFWQEGYCRWSAEDCRRAHPSAAASIQQPGTGDRGAMVTGLQGSYVTTNDHSTGANAEPVVGFAAPRSATTTVQDAMSTTSPATPKRDRNVRFQLPSVGDIAPQAVSAEYGLRPVHITIKSEHSGQPPQIEATLHMNGLRMFDDLLYPVSEGVHLLPNRMVTAKDLQVFHAVDVDPKWPAGVVEPHPDSVYVADKLAECCKLHASGLVSRLDRYTLLIYPSNSEEWQFLDSAAPPVGPTTSLRFRMFQPIANFDQTKSATTLDPELAEYPASVITGKALLGLDLSSVLQRPPDQRVVEQKLFMMWPLYRSDELAVLVQYFQDLKCKVYHSGIPGAWMRFKSKHGKGAVVIVHPEISLWELPELYRVLTGSDAKFFSLSMGTPEDPQSTTSLLFPLGKVFFITDDIFAYHPEKATEILEQFLENHRSKPVGGENDRIVARPGVKEWLRKLAEENTTERGRPDTRWLRLYEKICKLCPPEAEDPYDPPNPLPSSILISVSTEVLPSFYGLWDHDEEAATNMMVEWFAGWSAINAGKFRKIYVCYEPKGGESVPDKNGRYQVVADPRGWSEKFSHIAVTGPDDLIKRLRSKK